MDCTGPSTKKTLDRDHRRQGNLKAARRRRAHGAILEEVNEFTSLNKMDVEFTGCGAPRFPLESTQRGLARDMVFLNCFQRGNVVLPVMSCLTKFLRERFEGNLIGLSQFLKIFGQTIRFHQSHQSVQTE